MTEDIVRQALGQWGLEGCDFKLVAQRENRVYRVYSPDGSRALRLHRPGYRTEAELISELVWLEQLHRGGLNVPLPVTALDGNMLQRVHDVPVSLLTWLAGSPMGETGGKLEVADRTGAFRAVGEAMARLHEVSDAWQVPAHFQRFNWNLDGLVGETPLWGRFWENPQLSRQQQQLISAARDCAVDRLRGIENTEDYGLIHADLVRENVLFSDNKPQLIDFDDGGYGFRLFDVVTTLNKNRGEPDYVDLQAAFLDGYRRIRPIDTEHLPLFRVLRAFTYLGWIMTRMDEPGASTRCARFIENAVSLSQEFLATDAAC